MKGTIGYKQCIKYFNEYPNIKNEINELSNISTTRYNLNEKQTSDLNEFLKRPIRYYFDVTIKNKNISTLFCNSYYFDKKDDAEKAHHQLKLQIYDQKTAPFLNKINKGKKLTTLDKEKLTKLFNEELNTLFI